jgi:hypothetical protein
MAIRGVEAFGADPNIATLRRNKSFVVMMDLGAILGAFGEWILGIAPDAMLLPMLACILLISR